MAKRTYKIEVILTEATHTAVRELVDELTSDYDLDATSFEVKLFEQIPDGGWDAIGISET